MSNTKLSMWTGQHQKLSSDNMGKKVRLKRMAQLEMVLMSISEMFSDKICDMMNVRPLSEGRLIQDRLWSTELEKWIDLRFLVLFLIDQTGGAPASGVAIGSTCWEVSNRDVDACESVLSGRNFLMYHFDRLLRSHWHKIKEMKAGSQFRKLNHASICQVFRGRHFLWLIKRGQL